MTARLFVADAVSEWTRRSGQAVDLGVFDDLFVLKPADFDVMVMPLAELPPTLQGIHIAMVDWGLYASPLYWCRRPAASNQRDLAGHEVIRASSSLARIEAYQWLSAQGGTTALLASSPLAQLEACARGQGIALLPRRLADEDGRLVRFDREVPPPVQIWIVADASAATHPRVASFLRWAASHFPKAAASPPVRVAS
jgi:DNA-binding transcriptional LysR family regulator